MKKMLVISAILGMAFIAPELLAQSVQRASESEGLGVVRDNIFTFLGIGVDTAMAIAAFVGVVSGLLAIGPIRECFGDVPGQEKPVKKALGLAIVCALGLGATLWIYTVQYTFTGGAGNSGPGGAKVHERYKG